MLKRLQLHWPLYLIEGGGLAVFMLVAALADTLLEASHSPLPVWITSALARRSLMGLAMGLTSISLIYSAWGARSGAHFNPALTLTFALLGKVAPFDAVLYIVAQFIGGACGVLVAWALAGAPLAQAPVHFVVTVPGAHGVPLAFAMEVLISGLLMAVTLFSSNRPRWMRYTGVMCGTLIVLFVSFEAPFSGMSMNPARTVASALPSGIWTAVWLYFLAPPLGMLLAALVWHKTGAPRPIACAKLNHDTEHPCPFHCHYRAHGIHVPTLIRSHSFPGTP